MMTYWMLCELGLSSVSPGARNDAVIVCVPSTRLDVVIVAS